MSAPADVACVKATCSERLTDTMGTGVCFQRMRSPKLQTQYSIFNEGFDVCDG